MIGISACGQYQQTYSVTFDTDGGSYLEPLEVLSGDMITLPKPMKEGYIFIGWIIDDENKTYMNQESIQILGDSIFRATWEKIEVKSSNIYFYVDNNLLQVEVFLHGENIYFPNIDEKEGYIFDGWYTSIEYTDRINISTMPNQELSLYGRYVLKDELDTNTFVVLITSQDETSLKIDIIITGEVNFIGFSGYLKYSDNLEIVKIENYLSTIINSTQEGILLLNYVDALRKIETEVTVFTIEFVINNFSDINIQLEIDKMITINNNYEIYDIDYNIFQLKILNNGK
jgi:hypothetical protein